jgi:tetratricopeptide (TPR) repeat protein
VKRGLVLAAVAVLGVTGFADAAKRGKPNLEVASVGTLPAVVAEGATFKLKVETTANTGNGKAGATTTRFYLTRDAEASIAERRASKTNPRSALADVLLTGAREVPALDPGERSKTPRKKPTTLRVPLGTAAGEWELLACSDDRGAVREKDEGDNCRAAGKTKVTAIGGDFRIDALTDFEPVPSDAEAAQDLSSMKSITCIPSSVKGGAMPLKKALASIESTLVAKAGRTDVTAFARSADAKSTKKLEAAAVNALAAGTPGAALAALVRMHELEPKEASHLVGAASVATAVGMPREALGLLDGAARLDDRIPGAWGLNAQAVILANRGQALTSLGRFAEAEKALVAARQLEPALREASQTAAVASLCQDKLPAAVFHRRTSIHRDPPKVEDDDSLGIPTGLRELQLPPTPSQGPQMHGFYVQQQGPDRFPDMAKLQQAEQAAQDAWEKKPKTEAERRAGNRLLVASYRASQTPAMKALQKAFFDKVNVVHATHEAFWCGDQACSEATTEVTGYRNEAREICEARSDAGIEDYGPCYDREFSDRCIPATRIKHQQWLDEIQEAYDAGVAHQRAVSKRISAIAARVKDPHLHRLILLGIEDHEDGSFFLVQQPAMSWANNLRIDEQGCVEAPEPPPAAAPDPAAGQSPGACPDALKSTNALFDIGPVQLKVSCEQVQLAGSLGEGWIKGFGELTYDFRAGKISVFAGSQGEVGAGPFKADFKSGLYITVNNQGVEDAGWRVGPSVTVGAGPLEYNPSDMVDISFVGIFSGP